LLCTERQSTGRAARGPQRAKTSCGAPQEPQGTARLCITRGPLGRERKTERARLAPANTTSERAKREARDGLGAIELADEVEIDAAVIDVHMPLVDGVTAIARLRRDHPSLCLIAITGDREPQLLRAVEEAGADAVLLKEELVETLVDRLRHIRQTAQPGQTSRPGRGSSIGRAHD
jgi:CheY-like chemotaxis protein